MGGEKDRQKSPLQHHPDQQRKPALRVSRSPTPAKEERSRSPLRRVRDVRFMDEQGKPLAQEIKPGDSAPGTGRFKELRSMFPRKDGESRSKWKSRMMTQGMAQGSGQRK